MIPLANPHTVRSEDLFCLAWFWFCVSRSSGSIKLQKAILFHNIQISLQLLFLSVTLIQTSSPGTVLKLNLFPAFLAFSRSQASNLNLGKSEQIAAVAS